MTGASVLVVDDDIAALACARRTLVEAGYEVREALNGRRALQQVVASPPNLLLTDILMPDGDGIELINAVRRAFPAIPIIAMSERRHLGKLDLLNLATKIGADAVLEKAAGGREASCRRCSPHPRGPERRDRCSC